MIETKTFRLERGYDAFKNKPSESGLGMNQLIIEERELSKLVSLIQLNFNGPDYFGLEGNFSDLISLLQKATVELESNQSDLSQLGNEKEKENSYYWKRNELISTDSEMISQIVLGLEELIQSCRKTAMEAGKAESFLIKGSLEKSINELDKSLWIFTMFSKY